MFFIGGKMKNVEFFWIDKNILHLPLLAIDQKLEWFLNGLDFVEQRVACGRVQIPLE